MVFGNDGSLLNNWKRLIPNWDTSPNQLIWQHYEDGELWFQVMLTCKLEKQTSVLHKYVHVLKVWLICKLKLSFETKMSLHVCYINRSSQHQWTFIFPEVYSAMSPKRAFNQILFFLKTEAYQHYIHQMMQNTVWQTVTVLYSFVTDDGTCWHDKSVYSRATSFAIY